MDQTTTKSTPSSQEIISKLITEGTDSSTAPSRLADILGELAGWYAYLMDRYDATEAKANKEWLKIREGVKSVAEAERTMDMTELGMQRKRIRHKLKSIEKVMSSIKTRIKMKEDEYHNIV